MVTVIGTSELSLKDVGRISELQGLGWTVDPDTEPLMAHEKAGDLRSIGPAATIKALHTQVMLAAGPVSSNGTGKTVKAGSSKLEAGEFSENSQPILSGTEAAVIEDLKTLGVEYRENTMEILRRQKLQTTQKESLINLMHKFPEALTNNTETGFDYLEVEVDGTRVAIDLTIEEKEVLKTRVLSE